MQKVKLFIADSNFEEQTKLKEMLCSCEEFEIAGVADDGYMTIDLAKQSNPEIVLCNFALKNIDGITVTEKLKAETKTKIIMFSSAFSDAVIKRMVDSGVDYYMLRPFEPEALKKQILYMAEPQTKAGRILSEFVAPAPRKLDKYISEIFMTIGIPAHIKGFQFLREAIKITIEKPEIINCITKQLYPAIAKKFNTSPSKVERAIRHAIEVGWARGKVEQLNNLFGIKIYNGPHDRPTNGEFIALVADKMLIEGVS